MIEVEGLTKAYDEQVVLDNISLKLQDGENYCLMGPSGVGKTTLLRILMGLEKQDKGEIRGMEGKRLGVVFQEDRLLEEETALLNVLFASGRRGDKEKAKKQLEEILPAELLYRPVKDFSGGMKRRTAICRAVFASPDILIMDEPFTGLDEETKAKVMSYILRHKREDAVLLFTTHQEEDGRGLNARKIWIGK